MILEKKNFKKKEKLIRKDKLSLEQNIYY